MGLLNKVFANKGLGIVGQARKNIPKTAKETTGSAIKNVGTINKELTNETETIAKNNINKLVENQGRAAHGIIPSSRDGQQGYRVMFRKQNSGGKASTSEYFVSANNTVKL